MGAEEEKCLETRAARLAVAEDSLGGRSEREQGEKESEENRAGGRGAEIRKRGAVLVKAVGSRSNGLEASIGFGSAVDWLLPVFIIRLKCVSRLILPLSSGQFLVPAGLHTTLFPDFFRYEKVNATTHPQPYPYLRDCSSALEIIMAHHSQLSVPRIAGRLAPPWSVHPISPAPPGYEDPARWMHSTNSSRPTLLAAGSHSSCHRVTSVLAYQGYGLARHKH